MLLFGHRGAAGEAPENTIAGFRHAQGLGITGVELDVHLSADGVLMVIHDDTVERTTDARGPVASFTVDELRRLDARAAFPDWPERVGVPALADVLEAAPDLGCWLIEIKQDDPANYPRICNQLGQLIERHAVADRVVIISFDSQALEAMRHVDPALPRGFLGEYATVADVQTAVRLGCRWACAHHTCISGAITEEAGLHGLRVLGWTANREEEVDRLLVLGVDAIATDYPTPALAYLREKGVAVEAWQ